MNAAEMDAFVAGIRSASGLPVERLHAPPRPLAMARGEATIDPEPCTLLARWEDRFALAHLVLGRADGEPARVPGRESVHAARVEIRGLGPARHRDGSWAYPKAAIDVWFCDPAPLPIA